MMKILTLIAFLLMLSGCTGNAIHNEKLLDAEARAVAAEEKAETLENMLSALNDKLMEAEARAEEAESELFSAIGHGFVDPSVYNQNIIVQNPKKNRVTFEIDEKLVGRYIVEDDPEMYFEIKPDGKAELSLNELEGYGKYNSELIQLTTYYTEVYADPAVVANPFIDTVYINFNLVTGKEYFAASCGMSLTFKGDSTFNSFESVTYWPFDHLEFTKQV